MGLIDREGQMARLLDEWERPGPSLCAIYGRRRLGKTYFLQQFLKDRRGVYFLAADSPALENLEELLDQIRQAFPDRDDATLGNYSSWRTAFRLLCELAAGEPLAVVLDEFGYLVSRDESIPSILQAIWDRDAQKSHLKLILCGSELGTLSALDDYGKPLHGRFNWVHSFQPLDYYDAAKFVTAADPPADLYGPRELLTLYGVYGGGGRYLSSVDPSRSIADNVAKQILSPAGRYHDEGENLLRQEREIRDIGGYNAVLAAIASGETEWGKIVNASHVTKENLHAYMAPLQRMGWVVHEKPFKGEERRGIYRLADNMLKAWYRWVFRYRSALQMADPREAWDELVQPDIPDYMGGQFLEGVCCQHLARFSRLYGLPMIMEMGRWWSRQHDLEIDLVAELRDGSYLFGECKWASSPVPPEELGLLRKKVDSLPFEEWKRNPRYLLFSAGEFDPRLRELEAEGKVLLIGARELFEPGKGAATGG